tara:strand:- start:145 stop:852 length:708 start_codon:yes stop_codon:yes gene_type:complete
MIRLIISTTLLFFIACSSKNIVLLPEKVSPDVYKVLLENEDIKILEVTFKPGQSDNMHEHYPATIYIVEGGKVQVTLPNGSVNEIKSSTGFIGHNPNKARHQVKNIGDNTMKIILFERKNTRTLTQTKQELIFPEKVSPDVYKVLLENEEVKVTEVTFEPGQGDEMHQHGVMSIYGITGGKLQSTSSDGMVDEIEIPDGFVGHRNTITTHQMKNIGYTTIKIILVEHKKLGPPKG